MRREKHATHSHTYNCSLDDRRGGICAKSASSVWPKQTTRLIQIKKNSDRPVAGRNSFTEGQAKSKIEDAGYSNVSDLKKDDNGVWRGKASKGGSSTNVSIDFQGNVNSAK